MSSNCKNKRLAMILAGFCLAKIALAAPLPPQPTEPDHPGSGIYSIKSVSKRAFYSDGREGTLYLPVRAAGVTNKFPLLVFGHGYKVPQFTYRATFQHLARKGVAVFYVPYDINSADRNFLRMAKDYAAMTEQLLEEYSSELDRSAIVFSGHSNGATVALMAANLPGGAGGSRGLAKSVLAFAVNGPLLNREQKAPLSTPTTLVVGEDDHDDPPAQSRALLPALTGPKQLIIMRSYKDGFDDEVLADHGSIRTFGWFGPRVSPLHYHGYWKFMAAAALDAQGKEPGTNPWLYGEGARDTGAPALKNLIEH